MNDIKFRAWDKEGGEMHKDVTPMYRDGELENIIFDYENAGYNFVDIEIKYCDTVFLYEVNPYIIMQYTGLKDKNGTEIYEGDIIWDAHDEIHGKVTFEGGAFCVEWETHNRLLFAVVIVGCAEVVGNIYENTELLGDSQ